MLVTKSKEAVQISYNDPLETKTGCGHTSCPLKPAHGERRSQPRCPFTAAATVLEPKSGARVEAHTTDLCLGGCYVDTMNPFPAGTEVRLRLVKDGKTFESHGRVASSQVGIGMGIAFAQVNAEARAIVARWFAELRGEAAPEAHTLELHETACDRLSLRDKKHYAMDELLTLLMRKGVLTDEEGESILRLLLE